VNKILRAANHHEKEYLVSVNQMVTDEFIKGMANGVPILDTITRKCLVEKTGARSFRIILTQGLNRQIRRMCEFFGYKVTYLKRIRIMNIELGNLEEGKIRHLSPLEMQKLNNALKESTKHVL
jgi:23S rRNA pseudouridine2604 synthase